MIATARSPCAGHRRAAYQAASFDCGGAWHQGLL